MLLARVALGRVPRILRHVVPTFLLAPGSGVRGQTAAEGEDMRRLRDIARWDRGRLGIGHGEAVFAQPLQRRYRELRLRVRAAIDGAVREAALRGELVEVGGGDDTLRGAVLADEHDRLVL